MYKTLIIDVKIKICNTILHYLQVYILHYFVYTKINRIKKQNNKYDTRFCFTLYFEILWVFSETVTRITIKSVCSISHFVWWTKASSKLTSIRLLPNTSTKLLAHHNL
jgi:hypothetical protein